ncbi:glucuronyl esterase domain-containing protein [Saccharothrix sp. Mg75]|uniref:glucuronyl esterase domain-containing protein n=1 Tax=Saccharothrix sp. Mg75 TaxID=3445357 RepID=UPI003EEC8872
MRRALDALRSVPQVDTTKVGVSGHCRYGRAAVVAGAFDDRIALTVPGSSGTAGMGDYRYSFTDNGSDSADKCLKGLPVNRTFDDFFATRRRCHRGTVPGVTKRCSCSSRGSRRTNAASTARSCLYGP